MRGGWRERIGLHQLFPLLAHVVLFGAGHVRPVLIGEGLQEAAAFVLQHLSGANQ